MFETATTAVVLGPTMADTNPVGELLSEIHCAYRSEASLESWLGSRANSDGLASQAVETPGLIAFAGPLRNWLDADAFTAAATACPGVPLIVVCNSATVPEAVGAMRLGVANVLLLSQPADDLRSALQHALSFGREAAQAHADRKMLAERLSTLTTAENDVLDAMLIGMANKQIAQRLEIGLRTVELRRSKIMRKMNAKSLAELVKFVCIAKGLVDVGQEVA